MQEAWLPVFNTTLYPSYNFYSFAIFDATNKRWPVKFFPFSKFYSSWFKSVYGIERIGVTKKYVLAICLWFSFVKATQISSSNKTFDFVISEKVSPSYNIYFYPFVKISSFGLANLEFIKLFMPELLLVGPFYFHFLTVNVFDPLL